MNPKENHITVYQPNETIRMDGRLRMRRLAETRGMIKLLSLGALRLFRSSRFALTQPDAYGAGESLGDLETWRF